LVVEERLEDLRRMSGAMPTPVSVSAGDEVALKLIHLVALSR